MWFQFACRLFGLFGQFANFHEGAAHQRRGVGAQSKIKVVYVCMRAERKHVSTQAAKQINS